MISNETFIKARDMLDEAGIKHSRANVLFEKKDYSGAVEASQHSVEIAIKSLLLLFSIEPPKTHNPEEKLDKIIEIIESSRSPIIGKEFDEGLNAFRNILARMKFLSNLMGRLHIDGMYGFACVPPSKIFRKKDGEYFTYISAEILFSTGLLFTTVGVAGGFLTDKEKTDFEQFVKLWRSFHSLLTNE